MSNGIHRLMAGGILAGIAAFSLAQLPSDALAQSESADLGIGYTAVGDPVRATVSTSRTFLDFALNQKAEFAVVRISGPGYFSISKRVENTDFIGVDLIKDFDLSGYVDGEIDKKAVSGLEYLPEGLYTFEVMVHSAEGLRHTTKGKFEVYGGSAFIIPSFDEISNGEREVSEVRKPGILQRLAGSVLDFVIPSANADTADNFLTIVDTAADDDTGLTFTNSTSANTEFAIRNQDGNLRIFDDGGVPAPGATTLLNIVGSTGKVGFGTQNPQETIHLVTTQNLAGFRLEDTRGSWTISTGGALSDLGFRIRQSSDGTTPFRIEDGAPTDSIRVQASGDVGIGVEDPTADLHIAGNDIRLQSQFSGGDWRMLTGGGGFIFENLVNSVRPFEMENTAPDSSLYVGDAGNVGVGTNSPASPLTVERVDSAQIAVENTTGVQGQRSMLRLANAGKVRFLLENKGSSTWSFDNSGPSFDISRIGTGVAEFRVFNNGNALFQGDVTANGIVLSSSRALKTDFKDVEELDILDKVSALDIMEWRYKKENEGTSHIGPMAEDFQQVFGLGDGKTLNMVDTTGITFAAIQGLRAEIDAKDSRIAELEAQLDSRDQVLRAELEEIRKLVDTK